MAGNVFPQFGISMVTPTLLFSHRDIFLAEKKLAKSVAEKSSITKGDSLERTKVLEARS